MSRMIAGTVAFLIRIAKTLRAGIAASSKGAALFSIACLLLDNGARPTWGKTPVVLVISTGSSVRGQTRADLSTHRNGAGHLEDAAAALGKGDLESAEGAVRAELRAHPRSVAAYNTLGLILVRRGELSEAETSLRRSLQINPSYLPALISSARSSRR